MRIGLSIVLVLALTQGFGMTLTRGADVDLSTLHRERPRLFLPDLDLPHLNQRIANDRQLKELHAQLTSDAESILRQKPVERVLIGPRLLDKSRTALHRISLLAGLYRLDGEARFADRAIQEMLAVAAFEDWNPSHFLDVAEMTNAMAIGYDWLFDRLTPEQRTNIRGAIIEKGLKPGLAVYNGTGKGWRWDKSHDNWNLVCGGGLTVGALAIADDDPAIAKDVLEHVRQTIPTAFASYAPDGGWQEGPGYWAYATQYATYFVAALHSALGTDWKFCDAPGFAGAGDFRMHSIGPTGLCFNFADARPAAGTSAAMVYLAHRFDRPDFATHEFATLARDKSRPEIFHLLWAEWAWKEGSVARRPATYPAQPLDAFFQHVDAVFMRGRWDDPNTTFVGFKGGDNHAGHAHLDLGSFVLDSQGQRWVMDLGPDDYNLPGYFGKERFTYYRLRTEGQNTITVGGQNQSFEAKAPIVAYSNKPDEAFAVADLSQAYPKELQRARRGIKLFDQRRSALVQDDIEPRVPIDLVWCVHTTADVQVSGNIARLKLGGREMIARIISPEGATFGLETPNPPAPQRQDPSVRKLVIKLNRVVDPVRIAVVFEADEKQPANLTPLDDWISTAPVKSVR